MIIAVLALMYLLVMLFPVAADFALLFLKILPFAVFAGIFIGLGTLSWIINNAKGRDGGFWWGFFLGPIGIIVVLCRRNVHPITPTYGENAPSYLCAPGAWYCPGCGRSHAAYERSCVCGVTGAHVRDAFDFEDFRPEARAAEAC